MIRLVSFLRGINVGGRVVKKDKLKEVFANSGFQNVSTYKQSGNVIFETTSTNIEEIKNDIEDALTRMLNYNVSVFIRTLPQLKQIIDTEPFQNQSKEGTSFLVTLLPSSVPKFPLQLPLTIPKSTAMIISAEGTEVFSVTHGGGEGALPNSFIESKLKLKATTRNMNIIKEIVEKFG